MNAEERNQEFEDRERFLNSESKAYVSSKTKYEDVSSSAATLLLVGGVGLVLMILLITGVVTFPFNISTTWLFNVVMTLMFAIFIIVGIASAVNANKLKKKILTEDNTATLINEWCTDNIDTNAIDLLIAEELSEEEKYFERCAAIKDKICAAFQDVDMEFLDALIEDIYDKNWN